jgi:hypothetical protein
VKIWEPFEKQLEFLQIPHAIFEACYGGAVGGGKTELLIMSPIVYGWHKHPKFKGVLFRKTFKQLNETLIPRAHEFYKALGAQYNENKHAWTFPSGAMIWASYLETMKDARDHDTAEYNYEAFEELTHFEEQVYLYLTSRCRTTIPELPAIVRTAATPGNIGHAWVRKRFIEPAPLGGVRIHDKLSDTYRIFIRARGTDNPHLAKNDPGYYKRLNVLPPAERKARIDGDWWVFSGQVFSEFRDRHFEGEPERAIHVIRPFTIPAWWPRIVSVDWGYSAHTWAGWFAIAPHRKVYLYREYFRAKQNISTWSAELAYRSQYEIESIKLLKLDPSAWQIRGEEKPIWQQFEEGSGKVFRLEQADNARISGKLLLHDFLRWESHPERYAPRPAEEFNQDIAFRILRNEGLENYKDYLKQFCPEEPEDEALLPRLQIFDSCPEVIKAIQLCVYNEEGKGDSEDVAEFKGDDPYDGLRYGIKAIDRFLKEAKDEEKRLNEIATALNVIAQEQTSATQTSFYQRMAQIERKRSQNKFGVFRNRSFHTRYRAS